MAVGVAWTYDIPGVPKAHAKIHISNLLAAKHAPCHTLCDGMFYIQDWISVLGLDRPKPGGASTDRPDGFSILSTTPERWLFFLNAFYHGTYGYSGQERSAQSAKATDRYHFYNFSRGKPSGGRGSTAGNPKWTGLWTQNNDVPRVPREDGGFGSVGAGVWVAQGGSSDQYSPFLPSADDDGWGQFVRGQKDVVAFVRESWHHSKWYDGSPDPVEVGPVSSEKAFRFVDMALCIWQDGEKKVKYPGAPRSSSTHFKHYSSRCFERTKLAHWPLSCVGEHMGCATYLAGIYTKYVKPFWQEAQTWHLDRLRASSQKEQMEACVEFMAANYRQRAESRLGSVSVAVEGEGGYLHQAKLPPRLYISSPPSSPWCLSVTGGLALSAEFGGSTACHSNSSDQEAQKLTIVQLDLTGSTSNAHRRWTSGRKGEKYISNVTSAEPLAYFNDVAQTTSTDWAYARCHRIPGFDASNHRRYDRGHTGMPDGPFKENLPLWMPMLDDILQHAGTNLEKVRETLRSYPANDICEFQGTPCTSWSENPFANAAQTNDICSKGSMAVSPNALPELLYPPTSQAETTEFGAECSKGMFVWSNQREWLRRWRAGDWRVPGTWDVTLPVLADDPSPRLFDSERLRRAASRVVVQPVYSPPRGMAVMKFLSLDYRSLLCWILIQTDAIPNVDVGLSGDFSQCAGAIDSEIAPVWFSLLPQASLYGGKYVKEFDWSSLRPTRHLRSVFCGGAFSFQIRVRAPVLGGLWPTSLAQSNKWPPSRSFLFSIACKLSCQDCKSTRQVMPKGHRLPKECNKCKLTPPTSTTDDTPPTSTTDDRRRMDVDYQPQSGAVIAFALGSSATGALQLVLGGSDVAESLISVAALVDDITNGTARGAVVLTSNPLRADAPQLQEFRDVAALDLLPPAFAFSGPAMTLIGAIPPAAGVFGRIFDRFVGGSLRLSEIPFLAAFDAATYGLALALGKGANVELSLTVFAELNVAKLPPASSGACGDACQAAHRRLPETGYLLLQGTIKTMGGSSSSGSTQGNGQGQHSTPRVGASFAIVVRGIDTVFGVLFGAPEDRPEWLAPVTDFVGFLLPPSVTIGVVATTFESMTFPGMPQLRAPIKEGVSVVATVDTSAGCDEADMLCGFISANFPGLSLFFKMGIGIPPLSDDLSVSAEVGLGGLVFAYDPVCTETPRGQVASSLALPSPPPLARRDPSFPTLLAGGLPCHVCRAR